MGTKCGVRKHSGQESFSDVDKGSHPRLLTFTYGSWHTAGSHQPVVSGAPLK
jgi:hypothetical protein